MPGDPITVTLAGREFSVGALNIAQNRTAFPLCQRLQPVVDHFVQTKGAFSPSSEQLDDMLKVIYTGIKRNAPVLQQSDFDALEATPIEILLAFLAVRQQTGGYRLPPNVDETAKQDSQLPLPIPEP